MAVTLPYCKYNSSLNKYLIRCSNNDVNLDLFSYYFNFDKRLSEAKIFFFSALLPSYHAGFGGQPIGLSETIFSFSSFLVRKLRVNPYNELWEDALANWPTFPGTSLLDCCRTQFDVRREQEEARLELQAARKERLLKAATEISARIGCGFLAAALAYKQGKGAVAALKREYEKRKRLLLPRVAAMKAAVLHEEARQLREELFPSGSGGTDATQVAAATKAETKAAAQLKAYQYMCAKVWRAKRQESKAKRAKLEEELNASTVIFGHEASVPTCKAKARPRRRAVRVHRVPQNPLWGLYPYVGLGANMADPVCRVLSACVPIADKRPDLVSTIYAFVTGEAQTWLSAPRVCLLARRIIELSDWYPHELLAEELKKISDEENCKEAEREINLKYLEISQATENMRAGGFFDKVKGKAQDLWASVVDFASHPFRKYLATTAEFVEGFSHRVVDAVMSRVDAAIAQFAAQLDIAKTIVDQLVVHVKRWYTSLCTSFDDSLKLLGKWAGYALGLIVGVGVCHLVEVICAHMGLPLGGVITGVFTTAYMGWLFFKTPVGSELVMNLRLQVARIARNFFDYQRTGVAPDIPPNPNVGYSVPYAAFGGIDGQPFTMGSEEPNARAIPVVSPIINAMAGFGASMLSMKAMGLIEMGKLGAACHSLRMGKDALCEFVSTVLYYFGRLADKVTGRETEFFDELSILVQIDVQDWIKRSRGVLLESCYTSLNNMILSDVVNKLVTDGERLQVTIAGTPRRLSLDFGQLVSSIMKDLLDLQQRIVRHGVTVGRRKEPTWIYIFGPSHCGKSNMMDHLTSEVCRYFDLPYTYIARNGQDNFFTTGYKRQSVLQIDDLSCVETVPPIEGELINLVSCSEYPLKMADLSDKSISFQSPFIISTSNQRTCLPTCGITHCEAFNNRRAVVVEMRRKPGVTFDPMDCHAAMQGRFLDKRDHSPLFGVQGQPETFWKDVPEMTTILLNICAAHRQEQDILQEQHIRKHAVNDPLVLASERFLKQESRKALCYMPRIEMEMCGVQSQAAGCYYLCVDRILYTCADDGNLVETYCEKPDYERWEKSSSENFVGGVQALDALECRSILVSGFLRNLVQGQCCVLSVDEMSTTATMAQQRLFKALQLQERVYLRLIQKKISPILSEDESNVYSKNAWMRCLEFAAASRDYLKEHGLEVLLLLAALMVLCVALYYFIGAFIGVMGGALSMGAAMAGLKEVDMKAQYSSGAQEGRYRSRNIPIRQRYRYARGELDEEVPLGGQLAVALYGSQGRFISAMQYKGKSVMLTRHQMLMFAEKERVTCIYLATGESVVLTFNRDDVQEFPNHETCLWQAAGMLQLPAKFKDCFLENGETELAPAFELEGYVLRPDSTAFHYDHLKTWARVQYEPFVVRGNLAKEKYVNELPTSIWFQYQSRNNDCGMICLAQVGGKKKIVGLLVAGVEQQTWADILPNPCMAEMKSQIEYEFKLGVHTEGYTRLGYLTKDKAPHLPKKNSAVLVKPEYRIDSPVPIKEPSVISVEDPRCPKDSEGRPVDPIMKAFEKKFTTPMDLLEDDILESIAQEMVEEWYDCESEPLRDVPLEVAINGVPGTQIDDDDEFEDAVECFKMRTSPGYPYVLHKEPGMKGKEAYFELAPDGTKSLKEGTLAAELYENIVQYSKSAIPELVVIECPKDELLKTEKVKQGACRLFEIMPLHYNLFLREKTLAFSLFQQRNRHKLACQVGTKAYSHDWTHMYQRLVAKSDRAINCDYSGFDGLLNSQVVRCIANMINSMYHSPEETVVSKRQRYNMINALFGRLAILVTGTDREVMRVRAGLPSGFALTVVINSIFNEILMRYCFKVLVPSPQRNSFSTYVTLLVYGDDNLMSCTDKVAAYFNGESIKATLKKKNVTITDGSDKTSPTIEWKAPWELDFLKRRFLKLKTGVVQAPLDLSAIFSCLHWITPHPQKMPKGGAQLQVESVDTLYELALNVQVALTELYLHGDKEEFQRVRNFYVKKMNILPTGYYTWADREAFHMSKQTGMEAYQPAKEIDIDVGQEFARFMHTSDIGNQVHFYTPVLGVAGPFYKPTPDQLLVSTTPLKQGECGYWVPVETGMGMGSLPTISWVHRFMRPSQLVDAYGYKIWDSLRSHIESGKSLVFRSEAPYVAGNAALMAFGQSARLLEIKAALNLYRNVIPESTNGLEQYFDAAIPQASLPGCSYFANAETESLLQEHKTGTVINLTTEKKNLDGARNLIMQGQKLGKLPIMAATQAPGKFYVGLCCEKNFCPGHATSANSIAKAFSQCWAMRCAPNSSSRKVTFEPEWRKNKFLGIS
uniref:RNA1 polyprotein n=12 Tax=Cycas necrotic stunt virus TaxID=173976 RepID=A0A5B8NEI3_CNSV|nr:polyprotein 1 [Cycas necrotic stunt virus]